MSKPKVAVVSPAPVKITGTAYTIAKTTPTTAEAFEITIVDGIVTSCTEVTRAADTPVHGIGRLVDKLWSVFRVQKSEDFR